jgi:tetratricopeptide (TPR) repeat protein
MYLGADTALYYSSKALDEASDIKYKRGMAIALNNHARIAGFAFQDFLLQEEKGLNVITNYKDINDSHVIIEAYLNLALALFGQGAFDRSEATCLTIISLSQESDNQKSLGESFAIRGAIDLETGNYAKSFEHFNQSMKIFKSIRDSYNTAILHVKMGDLYRLAGDHETALSFYFQSLEHATGPSLSWHPLVDLGDISYSVEQYDSNTRLQKQYVEVIKSLTVKSGSPILSRLRKAEMYIASAEFDSALNLLTADLEKATKSMRNVNGRTMRTLIDLTKAYAGKGNFNKAFSYARQLKRIAMEQKARQYIRDVDWQLYLLHDHIHNTDSAYFYYKQFTRIKDEIALDQFSQRLAIYKAATENENQQSQIELLNREKVIREQELQLREQQLKNESNFRNILFFGVVVLGLFGFIVFRNINLKQKNEANRRGLVEQELNVQRLESARVNSELQQKATELEMQALRAQMNPHFIFNSLSSINRFILQNNRNQASEYLTKFSKLVRLILQNSQVSMIPLESELESLQLYLELEAVRFEHHFSYKVSVDNELDVMALRVPPLVIQPYAENAIWHGLMHKEDKGSLAIAIFQDADCLCCKITDDGIGRKKAQDLKSRSANSHKSMGMRITAERISLLQRQTNQKALITITDLVLPDGNPGGTEVLLKLPLQYV